MAMLDFILTDASRPFAISIGIMLGMGVLELVMALGGLGLSGLVDGLVPDGWGADLDTVDGLDGAEGVDADVDGELGDSSFLASALGIFGVGKAPLLVVIVTFLGTFGLSGLLTQAAVHGITGYYLPATLASIPALIGGATVTRHFAVFLGRLMPDVETSAVDSGTFVGRIAVLTLGTAKPGRPAQAKLRDHNGQIHYVMAEPDQANAVFREGDRMLLVSREGAVFKAIPVPSDALAPDGETP